MFSIFRKKRKPIENIWVVDGDSIECDFDNKRVRVRLYGIDAPELAQPEGRFCAKALRRFLNQSCPLIMEKRSEDQYGRVIGLIYPANATRQDSINLKMVREGYAYAFTRHGGGELGLGKAQREARKRKLGVWEKKGDGFGQKPWSFRKDQRTREEFRKLRRSLIIYGLLIIYGFIMLITGIPYIILSFILKLIMNSFD